MDRGLDFLRSQVNNAVMIHKEFLESIKSHASQADDPRFGELCNTYIPDMSRHQGELEQYQRALGGENTGNLKKMLGTVFEAGKDVIDAARQDDFLRLVQDIVMSRQIADTFMTFREAGRALEQQELERLGEAGARDHEAFAADANRLVQTFFIEHVGAGEAIPARR